MGENLYWAWEASYKVQRREHGGDIKKDRTVPILYQRTRYESVYNQMQVETCHRILSVEEALRQVKIIPSSYRGNYWAQGEKDGWYVLQKEQVYIELGHSERCNAWAGWQWYLSAKWLSGFCP